MKNSIFFQSFEQRLIQFWNGTWDTCIVLCCVFFCFGFGLKKNFFGLGFLSSRVKKKFGSRVILKMNEKSKFEKKGRKKKFVLVNLNTLKRKYWLKNSWYILENINTTNWFFFTELPFDEVVEHDREAGWWCAPKKFAAEVEEGREEKGFLKKSRLEIENWKWFDVSLQSHWFPGSFSQNKV